MRKIRIRDHRVKLGEVVYIYVLYELHPKFLPREEHLLNSLMPGSIPIDIEIDKLTRSIENTISGDQFKTEIVALTTKDLRRLTKTDWVFDWKFEAKNKNRVVYKLVIIDNPDIIQGLISVEDKGDHIYMHLIESNKFNRGAKKIYTGVPGNLIAFICKLSFELGYQGFISFESKTKLISHYEKSLGAYILYGNVMALNRHASMRLVNQYFPDF